MNLMHHLESGLERETSALAWHSVPVTVDTPITSSDALASVSVSRLWRGPLAIRPNPSQVAESSVSIVQPKTKIQTWLKRKLSARQVGWDHWDKLSEL